MEAQIETITKEKALEYLLMKGENRQCSESHVKNLVARQRRGEWIANGDTIRFDSNGGLRDGQHRLQMVVLTGEPFETCVVRGIAPEAFITMDTGRARGLGDVLSIQGYKNSSELAGALRYIYGFLSGRRWGSGGQISHEQHAVLLSKHQALVGSLEFYQGLDKPPGGPGYTAQTIATHYLFTQVNPDAATEFAENLVTGLRLTDLSDPVARLRGQLVSYGLKGKLKPDAVQVFALFIMAWNAVQLGRPQKVAYKVPQGIPDIRGFPKDLFEVAQSEVKDIDDAAEREAMNLAA